MFSSGGVSGFYFLHQSHRKCGFIIPHHHGKQQSAIEHGTFSQKINQHNNLPSQKNDDFLPLPEQLLNKQTTQHKPPGRR
jgi:hypothetical protein